MPTAFSGGAGKVLAGAGLSKPLLFPAGQLVIATAIAIPLGVRLRASSTDREATGYRHLLCGSAVDHGRVSRADRNRIGVQILFFSDGASPYLLVGLSQVKVGVARITHVGPAGAVVCFPDIGRAL